MPYRARLVRSGTWTRALEPVVRLWANQSQTDAQALTSDQAPDAGGPDDWIGEPSSGELFADRTRTHQGTGGGKKKKSAKKRSSGGGGGKKNNAQNALIISLWGAVAVGVILYASHKEILSFGVTQWLKGKGIESDLRLKTFSFDRLSGSIALRKAGASGQAPLPNDLRIDHFDIAYSLDLFAGKDKPPLSVMDIKARGIDLTVGYKGGQIDFGGIDELVRAFSKPDQQTATPIPNTALEDIRLSVRTDYGVLRGRGGLRIFNQDLSSLNLRFAPTPLNGPLGTGRLAQGKITAKTHRLGQGGKTLDIEAQIMASDLDLAIEGGAGQEKPETLAPEILAPEGQAPEGQAGQPNRLTIQGAQLDLSATVPLGNGPILGSQGGVRDKTGAIVQATMGFRAIGLNSPWATLEGLESHGAIRGRGHIHAQGLDFEGHTRLLSRVQSFATGLIDSRDLRLEGRELVTRLTFRDSQRDLSLSGPVSIEIAQMRRDSQFFKDLKIDLNQFGLSLVKSGLNLDFKGLAKIERAGVSDLSLSDVAMTLNGAFEATLDDQDRITAWKSQLRADLNNAIGQWVGLETKDAPQKGPIEPRLPSTPGFPVDALAAIDRFTERFRVTMHGLEIRASGQGPQQNPLTFSFSDLRLNHENGALVEVKPGYGQAVFGQGHSASLSLTAQGGGLPDTQLLVSKINFAPDMIKADFAVESRFSQGPVSQGALKAKGNVQSQAGVTLIALSDCAQFFAEKVMIGSTLDRLSTRLCQTGQSLALIDQNGWRMQGAFAGLNFIGTDLMVSSTEGHGRFEVADQATAPGLRYKAPIEALKITDQRPEALFAPLILSGTVEQGAKSLEGRLMIDLADQEARTRHAKPVGQILLTQDNLTGKGRLNAVSKDLQFSSQGLQPKDLSPAMRSIAKQANAGQVSLMALIDWDRDTSHSSGVMRLDGVDFNGALGEGRNLSTQVVLQSLAPLISLPGQPVHLDSFKSLLVFTDLKSTVEFKGDHVALGQSKAQSPGGTVLLEPMTIPMDGKAAIKGNLYFDQLDFGAIIAQTDLAKDMVFQGKLSGRLPFVIDQGQLRLDKGGLTNDGPGHLSIRPGTLTQMQGTGADVAAVTSDGQVKKGGLANDPGLLYRQALSDLSYTTLRVDTQSDAAGILLTRFHFKGAYDPPERKTARITFFDYITGKWRDKPIDLPSGTPVELILDMPVPINDWFDQISQLNAAQTQTVAPAAPQPKP